MQNIQYLKDQDAVLFPIHHWKKLQNELARLKKRVNKAEILTEFKRSLTELKKDLQSDKYDANGEISADHF
ncbi:MAG: hypothetical protein H0X72_02005 [Acidobacteria bacterium]|jgi:hypothetical protein|nr:hypothetical protein [Acidobacteriota bacterium]